MIKPSLNTNKKAESGFGMSIRSIGSALLDALNLNSITTSTDSLDGPVKLIDLVLFPFCPDSLLQYGLRTQPHRQRH